MWSYDVTGHQSPEPLRVGCTISLRLSKDESASSGERGIRIQNILHTLSRVECVKLYLEAHILIYL